MSDGITQRSTSLHKHASLVCRIFCASALVAPMSLLASDDRMDYVAERLERAIEHEFIGAAVVGYYDSGDVQYMNFGRISKDSQETPTESTLFEIGSITKVLTAALTQVLIDSKTLNWDNTLKSSLEDWTIASPRVSNITLRELATHSSGLPRMPLNWQATDPLDPYLGYDTEMLKAFVGEFDPPQLQKVPVYSNLGFGLLGTIAANAAGKSYLSALKDLVLEPLRMHHTTVGVSNEIERDLARGFAQGATIPNWNFEALAGAGAVLSSAEDMVQFIKKNIEPDDSAVVESLKKLQQVQVQPNQAFAWAMDQSETGKSVFWHAGLTGGYACFIAISPQESKGWVLLATSMHGGLINEIARSFYAPYQRIEPMDLSAYFGVFEIFQNLYMTFTERDDQLIAQATGQPEITLTFVEDREFKFDPSDMVLTFADPQDGKSNSVVMKQGGQTFNAKRVEDRFGIPKRETIETSKESLTDYPGIYRLAPNAVFTIVVREGQLFSMVSGQPTVPIFAMDKDRFYYKQLDAEILFERDTEGDVSGLTLFQNGEHKAPKIERSNGSATSSPQNRPN